MVLKFSLKILQSEYSQNKELMQISSVSILASKNSMDWETWPAAVQGSGRESDTTEWHTHTHTHTHTHPYPWWHSSSLGAHREGSDHLCEGSYSHPPFLPPSPDLPAPLNTSPICHHTKTPCQLLLTLPGRREGFLTSYTWNHAHHYLKIRAVSCLPSLLNTFAIPFLVIYTKELETGCLKPFGLL